MYRGKVRVRICVSTGRLAKMYRGKVRVRG